MQTPSNITAAIVQQHASKWNSEENLALTHELVQEAAKQGANLVVLQELHTLPYFCQIESASFFDLAEPIPGPSSKRLAQLASSLDIVLVASLFERRAAGIYHNTALVFDKKDGLVGHYRKMHIPDDPGYYEKYYFTPGDSRTPFAPIATSIGKLGVLICWDQWYPEAARISALAGADCLIYPTAIGWEPSDDAAEQQQQLEAWITIQRGHAIANHLPVLVANRVGFEPTPGQTEKSQSPEGIQFWGNSFITNSFGTIQTQANQNQNQVLISELELTKTEASRRIWPFFRDRRIDAYHNIIKRYIDD